MHLLSPQQLRLVQEMVEEQRDHALSQSCAHGQVPSLPD